MKHLSEEQIVLVLGVNVIDAPAIAENLHRLIQPGHAQCVGDLS